MTDTKLCTYCGTAKARTEFHRATKTRDGLQGRCKACALKASAERRAADGGADNRARVRAWQIANPEAVKAHVRKRFEKNPTWPQDYRAANAAALKVSRAGYYQRNRDSIRAYQAEYRERKRALRDEETRP
jgi:hypothetical protein